jgi:predicted RNA-binding protein with PUA-like domain
MREMQMAEKAFFYHSNCKDVGIVGVMHIVKTAYVDESAFDSNSPYYDPKSTAAHPRWWRVDVEHVETFEQVISLQTLKGKAELADFQLVQRGNRLSILPVTPEQWAFIYQLRSG